VVTVLDRPVTCKCGAVVTTLEAGKVHYLLAMTFPWWHVKKA
jgi:hypothetical protein